MIYTRGKYNEIQQRQLSARTQKTVHNLFNEAKDSDKIDGHGNWEFGEFFENHYRKGFRGHSLNWDLYAIGKDYFSKRLLIIIQIRQFSKRDYNSYAKLEKSYFLLGRNEDNTAFAHPVLSATITAALKAGRDPIRKVQDWIFKTDYTRILRQGDIALVPLKNAGILRNQKPVSNEMLIEGSHYLRGNIFCVNDNIYVRHATLKHLPKTHPDFINMKGFYKVISGRRASFYDFAPPTVD